MISHDDLDRILVEWFEADAQSSVPGGGLDRVRDTTRRRRPLPGWLASLGSQWVGERSASGTRSRFTIRIRALAANPAQHPSGSLNSAGIEAAFGET